MPVRDSGRAGLESAHRVLLRYCGEDERCRELIAGLRRDADALAEASPALATEVFVARAVVVLLVDGHLPHADVTPLADDLERHAGIDRLAVGLRVAGDSAQLPLPLEEMVEGALALLEAFAPLHAPSLWVPGVPGQPHLSREPRLLRWRSEVPSADVLALVHEVLDDDAPVARNDPWTAIAVRSFSRTNAVLVFATGESTLGRAQALAAPLGQLLSRAFERAAMAVANAEQSAALVRASERRLTRLGFDLHDGPLQDVALLSGELDALRQAMSKDGGDSVSPELTARLDDLGALVSYLDNTLREVANSVDADGEVRQPFGEALGTMLRTFAIRAGIEPEAEVVGDIDALSQSQRIALLRVIQESLSNIREHSGAAHVRISVVASAAQVDATIEDDGDGFDVEAALRRAARDGRMGLLGIMERVRLLGGFCDIVSRPGEGSTIALSVARWTPEMAKLSAAPVA